MPEDPNVDYVFKPPLKEESDTSPLVLVTNDSGIDVDSERIKSVKTLLIDLHKKLQDDKILCEAYGSEGGDEYSPFLLISNVLDSVETVNKKDTTEQALKRHRKNEDEDDEEEDDDEEDDDEEDDEGEDDDEGEEKDVTNESSLVFGSFSTSKAAAKYVLKAIGAHKELIKSITVDKLDKKEEAQEFFGDLTSEIFEQLTVDGKRPLVFYCGSEQMNPVPVFILALLAPNVIGGFISAVTHT
jgi:hypothetical protein